VHLGVATGAESLLQLLGKPGAAAVTQDVVAGLKRAGVATSLIFLAGIGGREMAAQHERYSAELADKLPLDRDDLIYIAPCDDRPDTEYRRAEREAGLTPLSSDEAWEQAGRLKRAMTCLTRRDGPRAGIYDISLFAY
jgi:hypothetical protein